MSVVTIKIKELYNIKYFVIFLILIIFGWQGYAELENWNFDIGFNEYIYAKGLSNAIPGVMPHTEESVEELFNKASYALTSIDFSNYSSILSCNIPLFKYCMISSIEESQGWLDIKMTDVSNNPRDNEDYFDQSEELSITFIDENLTVDQIVTKEQLENKNYITSKLINFDSNLNNGNQAINTIDAVALAQKAFSLNQKTEGPKVLIFHTHSMERYAGEEPGSKGVVDVGTYLKQILETQYGISTLHCTSSFDVTNGRVERDGSYERMEPTISKLISENPTIQLVIDLHRDGIDGNQKLLTKVNGKPTARLMFVNGLCKVQKQGVLTPVKNLPNPYVEDNLALSLQLQLRGNEMYPGLMRKILVKPYRYSLHMKPMSLLIEVGAQTNTKEEAMNAMDPLSEIIMSVIEKD